MTNETLMIVSLACSFAAYPAYAYGIARDGVRPTRPTWIMILVSDLLLFWFMRAEARWDWLTLGFSAGNCFILYLIAWSDLKIAARTQSLALQRKRDVTRIALLGLDPWTSKDIASVAVALGSLAMWSVTGSGVAAICFSLIGKIAASVPMWINLYKDPDRENLLPWVIWAVGGALYLMTISKSEWRLASLAVPVTFLVLECCVIGLLLRRFVPTERAVAA